jgi:hypothetical protein
MTWHGKRFRKPIEPPPPFDEAVKWLFADKWCRQV